MEAQENVLNITGAAGAIGFFIFLSVCVFAVIWSRTKQKIALQETLRQLIASDKPVTPEAIEALRGTSQLSFQESRAAALRSLLWGFAFLLTALSLLVVGFQVFTLNDPEGYVGTIIILLILPGLFKMAEGLITFLVDAKASQELGE